ncbi:MAG: enolase C-terminal domain-like protein [Pseudobdellovibrionaceae bacterium]
MIQFWFHEYELNPIMSIGAVAAQEARKGALMKVQWPNGKVGYADLHPWPELGDHDLSTHLDALRAGKISALVEQVIWLAKRDADARKEGKNLLTGLPKIKNHFLLNDSTKLSDAMIKEIKSSGFTTLKVKVGKDVDQEAKFIARTIKQNTWLTLRLDFNAKVDFSRFERFMSQMGPVERAKIEFVEDPIPWNLEGWREAAKLATLAIDNELDKIDPDQLGTLGELPFKVLVIKPARQDVEAAKDLVSKFNLRCVVTSALDHPVGVVHAAAVAGEIKKILPNHSLDAGCLSLRAYKPNEFTSRLQVQGPYLQSAVGLGAGFDDLLAKIEWTPLKK